MKRFVRIIILTALILAGVLAGYQGILEQLGLYGFAAGHIRSRRRNNSHRMV